MYTAHVRTTPHMQGHYPFEFATPQERAEFVKRPDVWWYFYPEDGEFDYGWAKGGAWPASTQEKVASHEPDEANEPKELDRW